MIIKNESKNLDITYTTYFNTNNNTQLLIINKFAGIRNTNYLYFYVNGKLKRIKKRISNKYCDNRYYYSDNLYKSVVYINLAFQRENIYYYKEMQGEEIKLSKAEFFIELAKLRVGE